jgi:hypothetical protein
VSPSEALNNRKLKIPLPSIPKTQQQETQDPMRKRDQEKKKMKKYSDHRQHSKTTDLKIGDTVLIRQPKKNKLTPPFNPKPSTVEARKGTMVTVKRGSKKITRNISFFKKIDNRATDTSDDEDDDDDFDCDRTNEDQHNQEPANQIDLDLNIELSMTIDTYCMLTVEICFSLNSYCRFGQRRHFE